jgi:hypothetical protein
LSGVGTLWAANPTQYTTIASRAAARSQKEDSGYFPIHLGGNIEGSGKTLRGTPGCAGVRLRLLAVASSR